MHALSRIFTDAMVSLVYRGITMILQGGNVTNLIHVPETYTYIFIGITLNSHVSVLMVAAEDNVIGPSVS